MFQKNPFIRGTLLLTLAGLLTRIIGFFYRIFLSQTIGEEGMGIYQLTSPVMAISFALTCSGIQTAISKYVASYHAKKQNQQSFSSLQAGFVLSMSLSILAAVILCSQASWICGALLHEPRCTPLVRLFALSVPFASLHACINGYYYGLRKTVLPASTQLLEQIVRVGTVFLLYEKATRQGQSLGFAAAMFGILSGEVAASLISLCAIYASRLCIHPSSTKQTLSFASLSHYWEILHMAIPLTSNRLVLNLLQSIEAVQIPICLMAAGMTNKEALSSYGVLTGMALPMILFPTALTSSVSILLLPYISEAQAQGKPEKIHSAIKRCSLSCFLLGSLCCLFFLLCGKLIGSYLFHSKLAGVYIQTLSIICPFFYLSSVLISTLHGLGKAFAAFLLNTFSLLIRLAFVYLLMPRIGMMAYFLGLFFSQSLLALCIFFTLKYTLKRPGQHLASC